MKTPRTKTQPRKPSASKAARKARRGRADVNSRDYIETAVQVLGLRIEPSWKPAIEANFTTTLRLAAAFMEFPLPDEAEQAPVFTA